MELLETEVVRTKCDICGTVILRDCWDGELYDLDGEPLIDYANEITLDYQIFICSEDCRDTIIEGPLHWRDGHFYRGWRS